MFEFEIFTALNYVVIFVLLFIIYRLTIKKGR